MKLLKNINAKGNGSNYLIVLLHGYVAGVVARAKLESAIALRKTLDGYQTGFSGAY